MTGVTCAACGAHVTVRGLSKCPICRGPIKPILDPKSSGGVPPPVFANKSAPSNPLNLILLRNAAIVGIVAFAAVWTARAIFSAPSPEKLQREAVGAALYRCQQAILKTAEYGGAETPPFVQNHGRGKEFYFAWSRGKFEFSNGFGARIPMSASCIGNLDTGEITSLTINARDII